MHLQGQENMPAPGKMHDTFKERYRNHIKSFNHKRYSNDTELSKYIWKLKDNKQDFDITWSVLKQSISYTEGSKRCNLCLEEKLCILKDKNKQNLLTKKSESVNVQEILLSPTILKVKLFLMIHSYIYTWHFPFDCYHPRINGIRQYYYIIFIYRFVM